MSAFGESDSAVRALSGVFAVLALPLMWLVGRRVGGRTVAWLTLVLLALKPWAFRYATETRMYSMVVVLALAGYLCLMNALEDDGIGWLVGVALVTGALLLTHYWALWLVAATVVLLHVAAAFSGDPSASRAPPRRDCARQPRVRAVAAVVPVPSCAHWLAVGEAAASVGDPHDHRERPWWRRRRGADRRVHPHVARAARAVRRRRGRRHIDLDLGTVPQVRPELAVTGLTLAFGVAAVFVTAGTYESRYAAVFVPFLLLAAAAGLTRFLGDWLRLTIVGLLVLGGLLGGYRNVTVERTELGAEVVPAINASAEARRPRPLLPRPARALGHTPSAG